LQRRARNEKSHQFDGSENGFWNEMHTLRLVIVLVRLVGLLLIFAAIIALTGLPEQLFAADRAPSLALAEVARLGARMLLLRVALLVLSGAALFVAARQVALALTSDLDDEL